MTMRKYLVTVHEDGHVTALEFEEPSDMTLTNYQAGARDAAQQILNMLVCRKTAYDNAARAYASVGKTEEGREEIAKAHAFYYAIQEIRREFKL